MVCGICGREIGIGEKTYKGIYHLRCAEEKKKRRDADILELANVKDMTDCLEARDAFYKFCVYMDSGFFTDAKWHLKLIAKYMQRLSKKEILKLAVSLSPRGGKSYLVSLFHSWIIGKFPEDSSMRNSYGAELAEKFSYDIREIIQKDKYLRVFPDVKLKQDRTAVNDWAITKARDSTYFCAGVGGAILGKGCKRISTLDDSCKNIEAALSEITSNATWNWYTSTHLSRQESGCAELHVATRWSKRDVIGRLVEGKNMIPIEPYVWQCGDMVVIVIPALINGKSFCEEIHTTEEYLKLKEITEDFIWEAEYMQNPIESKGLLLPIEELNRFTLKELQGKKPDAIVGVTDTADEGTDCLCSPVGKVIGEYTYLTDVVFTQEPIEVTEALVAQQIIDTDCELMKIESNNGGKGFALNIMKLIKGKSNCSIVFETQSANKETRILMGAGYIKNHFYFRNDYSVGSDYDHFMRQLTSYVRMGKNRHEDANDAITMMADYIKLIPSARVQKKNPVGFYDDSELKDMGYKPYEIKKIKETMQKSWEV